MARGGQPDSNQLALFDDPILWWPGQPPEPRPRQRRPPAPEVPPPEGQLALFKNLPPPAPRGRKRRTKQLKRVPTRQTYLDLADSLGLPRLQALINQPATYFMVDAWPLRQGLGVDTLLDARYRIEAELDDAFSDLLDRSPEELMRSAMTLWAGRRLGLSSARSPDGEALIMAVGGQDAKALDPFILRLRGLPGYLGHEDGPSPMEDGEELITVYDGKMLYPLLPREAQPISLERLLAG